MNLKSLTVSVAPELEARLQEELVRDTNYGLQNHAKKKHQSVGVESSHISALYHCLSCALDIKTNA
jgi:hypothetical protein